MCQMRKGVTAAGLVVNFAAIPLMTVVQVGGMALLAAAACAPAVVPALAQTVHLAAWSLIESARFVDLDGPLLLARDRPHGLRYDGSEVHPPEPALWG